MLLTDIDGNIYTFERLKEVYSIKGTFLDYQTLIRKIPRTWKEIINEHTKYRFPSQIDFNRCREEIAFALNDFGNQWCKRV